MSYIMGGLLLLVSATYAIEAAVRIYILCYGSMEKFHHKVAAVRQHERKLKIEAKKKEREEKKKMRQLKKIIKQAAKAEKVSYLTWEN